MSLSVAQHLTEMIILQDRAIRDADSGLDLENRAYYMTISIQRWLSVRLDIFGNILVLGIALFAAGFRNTVDPSKIGVVLSYTLSSGWPRPCLPVFFAHFAISNSGLL